MKTKAAFFLVPLTFALLLASPLLPGKGGLLCAREISVGNAADLQSELAAAASGDTIKLSGDIAGGSTTYTISASGVVLDGDSHTLSGGTTPTASLVPAAGTAIRNLTLQGFTNAQGTGGAMRLSGANFALSQVVFSDNIAHAPSSTGTQGGGALRMVSVADSTLTDLLFHHNATQDTSPPGSDHSSGGAIYISATKNVSFAGSKFTDNKAGNMGGAVFAAFNTHVLNFDRTAFSDNTSGFEGGAIYLNSVSNSSFRNAVFNGNTSERGPGGAVYAIFASHLDFTGAVFQNNAASAPLDYGGGAVSIVSGSDFQFRDTVFMGNFSYDGGAVYLGATNSGTLSGIDLTGARFEFNSADRTGGALSIDSNSVSNVTLDDVVFLQNTAGRYGGAIATKADLCIGGNSLFSGNTTGREGGAIYLSANLTLNPGAGQTSLFATASDTIAGDGSVFKTGAGRMETHANIALDGDVEVRQGELVLTDDAKIDAYNFTLASGSTLGVTLGALDNPLIRLDTANGGHGVIENGSVFQAALTGEAAALKAGESVDVAVLSGATQSTAADFAPSIQVGNNLYTAVGKFTDDTWYLTLSRRAAPALPPDIGDIVDNDYKPGENPWLDDIFASGESEPRAILSGVNLVGLVQTFFIVQDISGIMRNAAAQGPDWARRQGGKVWGDERGVLWAAPIFLHDDAYGLRTRHGLKADYSFHLGGGMAGLDRNAADDTVTVGAMAAAGGGRMVSGGEFLRTSNTTQFVAGSLHGEWRPAALDGKLLIGAQAGVISTENSAYQAGTSPLTADIYAKAFQLDVYAEHRKVLENWELSARIGAGVVWYHRPTFSAKAMQDPLLPGEKPHATDVAEYETSRETTVRLPVQVKARRIFKAGDATVTPEVYVGYQHVLGDRSEDYRWRLTDGQRKAHVFGPQLDRHNGLAGLSVVWEKKNVRAALSWDAEFSRHRNSHAVGLTFSFSF